MFRLILILFLVGLPSSGFAGYGSTVFDNPKDVTVDIKHLSPGITLTVDWNGHGVIVYRRTKSDIQHLKDNFETLSDPYGNNLGSTLQIAARSWGNGFASLAKPFNMHLATSPLRSIQPEIVVLSIASSYSGCAVTYRNKGDKNMGHTWQGGFYDPCRDVRFDLSGRVLKGHKQDINLNLLAIPHRFESPDQLVIGIGQSNIPKSDFRPLINFNDLTPSQRLATASELGVLEQVILAVKLGAEINALNEQGFTALYLAAGEGSYPVSKWLLEHGANPNQRNLRWGTPACAITLTGDTNLIALFGLHGTNWEDGLEHDYNCAAPRIIWSITNTSSEDMALDLIRALVKAGANPKTTYFLKSAVDYAKQYNYLKVVEYLSTVNSSATPPTNQ